VESTYALLSHVLNVFRHQWVPDLLTEKMSQSTHILSHRRANTHQVHPTAIVEGHLEEGVSVGAGCYIGKNSVVQKGTILEPRVTILENCSIGEGSVLQSGVVVGCAGFGFYNTPRHTSTQASTETKKESVWESIPHLAGVRIGKGVWLGANTVVAAGVLHPTIIEDHCKLDSHIQVAHNVHLGAGARMASQSGIAGSTYIGKRFLVGGASSIAGHLIIGDDVTVAARSGVTKDLATGDKVGGYPAQSLHTWKKQVALLKQWVQERKKRRSHG
jgi:UDP-3-O-[3-hydroxymyristoyl] glucosamine N-acyltransferase